MTLTVFDDGKAILSIDRLIARDELEHIQELYGKWATSEEAAALLILPGTVVRLHEKAPGELVIA